MPLHRKNQATRMNAKKVVLGLVMGRSVALGAQAA